MEVYRVFQTKTQFALNKKDKDAIVFYDADTKPIRLTVNDFASEEEFARWKAWYLEDLRKEELEKHTYLDHTLPMECISESWVSVPSPEEIFEQFLECADRTELTAEILARIRGSLTKVQFRRLWMYYAEGMTEQEIAEREGVGQQRISKSLIAAKKKLIKMTCPENRG